MSYHEEPQPSDYYKQFFHPNICHVCKTPAVDADLILCNWCRMISYCSEEHKLRHRPYHIYICSLITSIIIEDPEWDTRILHFDTWIEEQKNFALLVQTLMLRKLKPYEMQMFMYAKSCFICHRRNNLYTCEICLSASYCIDHIREISIHQISICYQLTLSLRLDIISFTKTTLEILNTKFTTFPDKKRRFTDMDSFCRQYYYRRKRHDYLNSNDYVLTDYVSDPLTLYNGLRSVKLFCPETKSGVFVIHVIAANYLDIRNCKAWELFLHLLRRNMELIIVMVGPELLYETYEHDVCSRCKAAKKKLTLQLFPFLYHEYVLNTNYKRPNVVVGYQAELANGDTWSETIRAIQTQNCLLLLTAKSQVKAEEDITMIQEVLGESVSPVLQIENDFCSYRPYWDYETDLFYRNIYLLIYNNLNNSSNLMQ